MELTDLIARGARTNYFVYDDEAKPHDFSPRLVRILDAVCGHYLRCRPLKLLVPAWTKIPCDGGTLPVVGGRYWGVPVEAIPDGAEDEYRRQGGVFSHNKQHLVALVTDDGRVVMGGF